MKKLLCLILSLAMLLSFSACSKPADSPNSSETLSKTDEAKAVVDSFMESFASFELKDATELLENGDSIELPFDNMDGLYDLIKDQASESMGATGMEEDIINNLLVPVFDEYISSINYSIESSDEKDNKFVFTVNLEYIDPDALSDLDINEEAEQFGQELVMEALENGTITEDMTEEELMNALLTPILEGTADLCIEAMMNCEKTSETIELTVIEDGGKFVIENNADLEGLFDMGSLADFTF